MGQIQPQKAEEIARKWVVFMVFIVKEIPCGEHSSPLQKDIP